MGPLVLAAVRHAVWQEADIFAFLGGEYSKLPVFQITLEAYI